jgi:hypothetical protein
MTARSPAVARAIVLGVIRILGYAVAACSIVAGIAYTAVAALGGFVLVSGMGFVHRVPVVAAVNATAFLLTALTVAGIALVVGDLAWRTRRGVTFAPAVSRSAWALAVILGVGSWLAHIAQTVSDQTGLIYPDDADPSGGVSNFVVGWNFGPQLLLPDPAMLGLAIALAVLAYIVQSGERVQRDTEGLV